MARGRLLTIELLNDERFNLMSEKAQLLFMRAWPHLDRDGRITGNPRRLWAQIDVDHIENMDRMGVSIEEWLGSGLVMRYQTESGPVLFFLGFRLHNLRMTYSEEAGSVWPPPPGWHNTRQGPVPDSPELAERLAENISTNCHYKTELLRHAQSADNDLFYEADNQEKEAPDYIAKIAELEAKVADLTANLNRPVTGRLPDGELPVTGLEVKDQDQDQHDDVVVDLSFSFSPSVNGGGAQRGRDHLTLCEDDDLRHAAWELGIALFGYGWTNYEAFVQRQPIIVIIQLLEWIAYYADVGIEQTDRIRDMPAILRAHINKQEHALLRRPQREGLIYTVLTLTKEDRRYNKITP